MKVNQSILAIFAISLVSLCGTEFLPICSGLAVDQAQEAGQPAVARRIGAIKSINGNTITLTPDSGPDIAVTVQANARILRIAPGEKDLKNAAPVQLQDLQVGDRVRVRGQASADGTSIAALEVIVIPRSDLQALHEQERQDWQKRGVGGLVDSVDAASGRVTLSIPGLMGKKTIVIHTNSSTVIHRYSPDSARPEDAKVVTIKDIQVGDQLRARGNRSPDGSELTAEEIYTGVFLQFDATIKSIDASSGTLSVQDLKSKKTMQLKVGVDSQLHQIPEDMAQRFAGMLRMVKAGGIPGGGANPEGTQGAGAVRNSGAASTPNGRAPGGASAGGGRFGAGGGDLQRRLDQTPTVKLADLHKGDAVSVLATQGSPSTGSTVIKMFSGVEPILQAAPSGSQAMMLAPWGLGGAPGGDASQ